MLKKRILTATVLIPLMLLIIFYLPMKAFLFFTGLATLMAAWEWSSLMGLESKLARLSYPVILLALFVFMLFIAIPLMMMVATGWWILALGLIALYPKFTFWWRNNITMRGVMGALVLIPCWMALNYVRNLGNGAFTLLYLFILIWGADTAAYFVGKKWGSIKLAPKVSPGKSVQGFVGALVFAAVAVTALINYTGAPRPLWGWLVCITFATVIASVVGDLFESMLKRNAGVKDSGVLLPGHGGLLDRIDSLTAAAPVYSLGIFLMMLKAY